MSVPQSTRVKLHLCVLKLLVIKLLRETISGSWQLIVCRRTVSKYGKCFNILIQSAWIFGQGVFVSMLHQFPLD